jgi:S-DNA-T family DNA segregation ATPase FtsK/SpoIIIE
VFTGLLRQGPAAGLAIAFSADRTGFPHRIAAAVEHRLVLRQADSADAAAFGLGPRDLPTRQPAGRGVWAATGTEVQVALLDPDPAAGAQARAVREIAERLAARWDGLPPARLPRRLDPLPAEITAAECERLRTGARPRGPLGCTPAVGGHHLAPIDVDLADCDGTFVIAGASRSGRSTALAAMVRSLAGRAAGEVEVVVVAPRPSPVRALAGLPGIRAVLGGPTVGGPMLGGPMLGGPMLGGPMLGGAVPGSAVPGSAVPGSAVPGGDRRGGERGRELADLPELLAGAELPVVLAIDDAELVTDPDLGDVLEDFARSCRDSGGALLAAGSTEDLLLNRFRGWLPQARRSRCGLLLNPTSHLDGEVFELRLPRSLAGSWPPGRGLLVQRGVTTLAQVPLPDPAAAPRVTGHQVAGPGTAAPGAAGPGVSG